jgi:hypothetical protein
VVVQPAVLLLIFAIQLWLEESLRQVLLALAAVMLEMAAETVVAVIKKEAVALEDILALEAMVLMLVAVLKEQRGQAAAAVVGQRIGIVLLLLVVLAT